MNFAALVQHHGRSRGGQRAVVDPSGEHLTWSNAASQIASLAGALTDLGVSSGDRVAILMPNSIDFFLSYFATLHLGGCAVPLNTRWTPAELGAAIHDSGAKAIFASASSADAVATLGESQALDTVIYGAAPSGEPAPKGLAISELATAQGSVRPPEAVMSSSLAEIIYTAGTSGRPKGVPHSHQFLSAGAWSRAGFFELGAEDVGLSLSPLFHIGGLAVMTIGTAVGSSTVFMPRWEVEEFLRLIDEHRVTYMHLVTTLLVDLERFAPPLLSKYDTGSLRVTFGGGSIAAPEQYDFYERRIGGLFCGGYGRTEASGVAWNPADADLRKEGPTVGFVMRDVATVRIIDPTTHSDCSPGDAGEILLAGDGVARGYWNREDLTSETFDSEGWLHTGDYGRLDADGFLHFVGRIDQMIKTGGENVYPGEVEEALGEMPDIQEVAVCGVPDARLGSMVGALVVKANPTVTDLDITEWCRERIGAYKKPRLIVFCEEIPKLGSGKVDYRAVASRLNADLER